MPEKISNIECGNCSYDCCCACKNKNCYYCRSYTYGYKHLNTFYESMCLVDRRRDFFKRLRSRKSPQYLCTNAYRTFITCCIGILPAPNAILMPHNSPLSPSS